MNLCHPGKLGSTGIAMEPIEISIEGAEVDSVRQSDHPPTRRSRVLHESIPLLVQKTRSPPRATELTSQIEDPGYQDLIANGTPPEAVGYESSGHERETAPAYRGEKPNDPGREREKRQNRPPSGLRDECRNCRLPCLLCLGLSDRPVTIAVIVILTAPPAGRPTARETRSSSRQRVLRFGGGAERKRNRTETRPLRGEAMASRRREKTPTVPGNTFNDANNTKIAKRAAICRSDHAKARGNGTVKRACDKECDETTRSRSGPPYCGRSMPPRSCAAQERRSANRDGLRRGCSRRRAARWTMPLAH